MIGVLRYWGFSSEDCRRFVESRIVPYHPRTSKRTQPVFGRVTMDQDVLHLAGPLREHCEHGWWTWIVAPEPMDGDHEFIARLRTLDGREFGLLSRPSADTIRFHFDLDATISFIQNEGHISHRPPFYLRFGVTPDQLPAWMRIGVLRTLAALRRLRRRPAELFPSSPLDPAVAVWRHVVRSLVSSESTTPEPIWPAGKKYCVVLTHDIDTPYSLTNTWVLDRFRDIEESAGVRSAWMVVASLARAHSRPLRELHAAGHEIGFHDLVHDHRIAFLPPEEMRRRLTAIKELHEQFGTIGFRSPNYLHTPQLFDGLSGLAEYDMSMHACLPLLSSPAHSHVGCATAMPFFFGNSGVLEIPNTVPEDISLELEGLSPDDAVEHQWQIIEQLKARGEVANIITHPEPMISAREPWLRAYAELVNRVASDADAWIVRPCDLNEYWRARATRIDQEWENATNVDNNGAPNALRTSTNGDRVPAVAAPA